MADTKIVNQSQRNERREEREERKDHKDRDCPVCEVGEGKVGKAFWPRYPKDAPVQRTIYARSNGSNEHGKGTQDRPYRTLTRAVRDVPPITPPGILYRIDITGITEELPTDYTLPEWKTWAVDETPAANPYTFFQAGVEIFATPQPVAALPVADTVIVATDVASATPDPLTGLYTITLNVPRASWTAGNLLGKQVLDSSPEANNDSVVGQVLSTSSIMLTSIFAPTYPLQLVEPSAWLHGSPTNQGVIRANNIESIGFTGIKITSDISGFNGLLAEGTGNCICSLCELDSPLLTQSSGGILYDNANRVLRCWVYNFPTFGGTLLVGECLINEATPTSSNGAPFFNAPTTFALIRSIVSASDPIEVTAYQPLLGEVNPAGAPHILIEHTLVQNGNADGFIFHGVKGDVRNCNFAGNAGNGITVDDGGGLLTLENVGSSTPNLGAYGLQISDGMQVLADAATVGNATPLSGATNQVEVGNLAPQTWASVGVVFAASPKNSINDYVGVTATGARLGQS
jgi:hypothetical protein